MENVVINGNKERTFPKALYKQCIWMLRDYRRLCKLAELAKAGERFGNQELIFYADEAQGLIKKETVYDAYNKVVAIEDALTVIPEEFRQYLMANLVDGEEFDDNASYNTWKKYKKAYIIELAKKLNLY